MSTRKAIIVSGYFNPLHKGHIEYFNRAKEEGEFLCVIVNNDEQRLLKGSREFQDEAERLLIISSLRVVDKAILSVDKDRTVRKSLKALADSLGDTYSLAFANGGDQDNTSIPEAECCEALNISLIDGMGAKVQSSSWLLAK